MKLKNLYVPAEAVAAADASRYVLKTGRAAQDEQLLREHVLEIVVNERPVYEVVCTPTMLPELVLGRLLSQGIIRSAQEVDLLYLCAEGVRATVYLNRPLPEQPDDAAQKAQLVATCCTDSLTGSTLQPMSEQLPTLQPIPWRREWVSDLAGAFFRGTPLYRQTHCAHSAFLMRNGEILAAAEDIGRHNALDKIFGWAMLQEIPLRECICFTSGRIPVDMTMKVIRAGVPVLVSKAQPTDRAVALAEKYGLTMVGSAHEDSFLLYAGAVPL